MVVGAVVRGGAQAKDADGQQRALGGLAELGSRYSAGAFGMNIVRRRQLGYAGISQLRNRADGQPPAFHRGQMNSSGCKCLDIGHYPRVRLKHDP